SHPGLEPSGTACAEYRPSFGSLTGLNLRLGPVPQRMWPRERKKFLHKIVSGICAQPDKAALDAMAKRSRAARLPDIVELPSSELAKHARIGEFAFAGIGFADDDLLQSV